MIEKKDENGITELEKALNLVSKINTNNMNYYNRDSVITSVNDPNQILKEFCEVDRLTEEENIRLIVFNAKLKM